jgi:hypothetical protein
MPALTDSAAAGLEVRIVLVRRNQILHRSRVGADDSILAPLFAA